jgi:hypothetical protein
MLDKFNFELELEKAAERHYFNAASAMASPRGGNSRGNEVYFGYLGPHLRQQLNCQHILLKRGECPDSGVFGDFNYKHINEINWESVKRSDAVVLEVNAPNEEKRYIEVPSKSLPSIPNEVSKETKLEIKLNDLDIYGEFFGIEFKASKNSNPNVINVASFNSTCPSNTKTSTIKVNMIHNFKTKMRKCFQKDKELKILPIKLNIQFSMYYFIVNDEENGTRSIIRHILVCTGKFFSLSTTEEEAVKISKQIMPKDLGLDLNLYRVNLRYRPFFESRTIQANGFGLYTSWEPKIPGQVREEKERLALLDEVERIQQPELKSPVNEPEPISDDDNVIYLNLNEARIRKRSAA